MSLLAAATEPKQTAQPVTMTNDDPNPITTTNIYAAIHQSTTSVASQRANPTKAFNYLPNIDKTFSD